MDKHNRRILLSASDLVNHAACGFLTGLELQAVQTGTRRPELISPDLLARITRGFEHEEAFLAELEARGLSIVKIETDRTKNDGLLLNAIQTQRALQQGVDVVYQPTFLHHRGGFTWQGHGDFAIRNADGVYEMYDTKLARKVKPGVLVQLGLYSEMLASITGIEPEQFHVVLGDGRTESFRVAEILPFVSEFRRTFENDIRQANFPVRPEPVPHCDLCNWKEACKQRWVDDDHLSLVRGMRPSWRALLEDAGIDTVARLAVESPARHVGGMTDAVFRELHSQARLQVKGRESGQLLYELHLAEPDKGYSTMPPPRPSDLFLDFEANALERDPMFAYLFVVVADGNDGPEVEVLWADDDATERDNIKAFARRILQTRALDPGMHVYHWGSFDHALMRTLLEYHQVPLVDEVMEAFVDMYAIFRDGGRFSESSMSIKKAEKLWTNETRASEGVDGASSIAMREMYLRSESDDERATRRAELVQYCVDDTVNLVSARAYFIRQVQELYRRGDLPLPTLALVDGSENPDDLEQIDGEPVKFILERKADALRAGLPEDPALDTSEQQVRRLLADLMNWHRRERKPEWREYFERIDQCRDVWEDPKRSYVAKRNEIKALMLNDDNALGGLKRIDRMNEVEYLAARDDAAPTSDADLSKAPRLYERYTYDPAQDHRLKLGGSVVDPTFRFRATILELDDVRGELVVKRGGAKEAAQQPLAEFWSMAPSGPPSAQALQGALLRIADALLEGLPAPEGMYGLTRQLLEGAVPRLASPVVDGALKLQGEEQADAVARLVNDLDHGILAVQGPPGSGKTYAAARAIREFLQQHQAPDGRPVRVGVMASSHKVIANLLDEVARQAGDVNEDFGIIQANSSIDRAQHAGVRTVSGPGPMRTAMKNETAQVYGGTAWYFARPENLAAFDLLVIDEAGQVSLTDAVVASQAARNIMLVGDPAQLIQPIRGSHPDATRTSAIGQIIGDHATMPPDRGVFFEHTRRLGANCAYISEQFYEGRLERHPQVPERRIIGLDVAGGLAYFPVQHEGLRPNKSSSTEEAEVVRDLINTLQYFRIDDGEGNVRPMRATDIMVVTPFNAQVARIRAKLKMPEVEVLTVDKAQGQEAAVVIYSMATTNPKVAPRGAPFLFARNRLNVAISRAQALSVIVASPDLFAPDVSTVLGIRQLGSHLRFVELATGNVERLDEFRSLVRFDIGRRVRTERKVHKLSQRQLANLVGCHQETIGRLERGEVDSTVLARVVAQFGWDPQRVDEVVRSVDTTPLATSDPMDLVLALRPATPVGIPGR